MKDKDSVVFEVCDTTNCEMYYTMGIFLSKDEAIRAVDKLCLSEHAVTESGDDYEQIEIRERRIGMCTISKAIYTKDRSLEHNDDGDGLIWKTK